MEIFNCAWQVAPDSPPQEYTVEEPGSDDSSSHGSQVRTPLDISRWIPLAHGEICFIMRKGWCFCSANRTAMTGSRYIVEETAI